MNAFRNAFAQACSVNATGGDGGGSYTAQAVHLDGTNNLILDPSATLAADSPTGIMTIWTNGADIFNGSPNPAFVMGLANDTFDIKSALSVQNGWGVDFAEGPNFDSFYAMNNNSNPIPAGWNALLCSWDMNHASGARVFQCYYGDTVQAFTVEDDYGIAFSCNYSDTGWMFFGSTDPTQNCLADVADFQMWCGTGVDLSVQANRRLFIDDSGKPVNPTVAASALGQQTVLFSGDSTTFATNRGTASAAVALTRITSGTFAEAGPTSATLTGAAVGRTVHSVTLDDYSTDITDQFEATISVNDQIQQTGSNDYTGHTVFVALTGGLTDATTSPST